MLQLSTLRYVRISVLSKVFSSHGKEIKSHAKTANVVDKLALAREVWMAYQSSSFQGASYTWGFTDTSSLPSELLQTTVCVSASGAFKSSKDLIILANYVESVTQSLFVCWDMIKTGRMNSDFKLGKAF